MINQNFVIVGAIIATAGCLSYLLCSVTVYEIADEPGNWNHPKPEISNTS